MMKEEGFYLGFDIGGTYIKSGIVSDGVIKEEKIIKSRKENPKLFYESLDNLIHEWKSKYKIEAIGLGFPGLVDSENYRIFKSPNIPAINNTSFRDFISEWESPVFIDNDANFAAYGEYSVLSKKKREKVKTLVLITLGSGVGTGIIINGDIYHGAKNFIEGGHMIVNPEGEECGCGSKGCFETEVSSHSIKRVYKSLSGKDVSDPKNVYEKAKTGDKFAIETFKHFSYFLGISLASINNLLNPDIIVLGGGLSYFSEFYFEEAKRVFEERSYLTEFFKPEIYVGILKNKAGIIGAANYAREKSRKR